MEDKAIIDLYWTRSENAISQTALKYGAYCYTIAFNILSNREDSEESVNDTYLAAWNTIPPKRPGILSAFLGKITRYISLDRWKRRSAAKRGGGQVPLALEELEECICGGEGPEGSLVRKQLLRSIESFLDKLPVQERQVFVCRYWFLASIKEISLKFEYAESKTKSILFRTRKKLMNYLLKEGLV